jgi:3-dehydroquinate dehydratase/shikimate dehydrogenase
VDDIIAEAILAQADVLKFTWPTPDLDAAWPLLAICTGKQKLPIVGMPLGAGSITFSLLAHKFGSPWIYAALEQGMEAHEGQPTISDLNDAFDFRAINQDTRLVGLLGPKSHTDLISAKLNAGMKAIDANFRCLPLAFKNLEKLAKRLETLKVRTLVVSPSQAEKIRPLAATCETAVEKTGCLDLLLRQADGWHGYNLMSRSVLSAIESKLHTGDQAEHPLDRGTVLLIGTNELARAVAFGLAKRKAALTLTGPREDEVKSLAEELGQRYVPLYNLYDSHPDVVILADPALQFGHRKTELNSAFLRPTMTVADVSHVDDASEFLNEARVRGCQVVEPADMLQANVAAVFKTITGQVLPEGREP